MLNNKEEDLTAAEPNSAMAKFIQKIPGSGYRSELPATEPKSKLSSMAHVPAFRRIL